jgi:glyoxylase-like metal-dependent hydrolase (beta-lactamase superfamily II)
MKIRQVSDHIYALSTWVIIPIHVWLVRAAEGLTLVDAGIGPMAGGILRTVDQLGHGPIRRILLTHGHVDHVGAIDPVLKNGDIPVLVHPEEIPCLEGDLPYPRRKKAQRTVRPGVVTPLPLSVDGMPVSPDGDAPSDGLVPYHTPGHSPGHTAWFHPEDGVLLAGDLFTSRKGQLRPPIAMFTADMAQAMRSARILEQLNPSRLEVCHGGPVRNPLEQLPGYLERYA